MSSFKDKVLQQLSDTGGYQTDTASRRNPRRMLPSLHYHADVLALTIRAGRAARKGQLDTGRWMQAATEALAAVENAGGSVTFSGFEKAARLGMPVVWAANHMSTVETMVLPCAMTPLSPVSIVLKEELLTYPYFGDVLKELHPITVTRKDPREDLKQVMKQGVERLKAGRSVLVFPQSTRIRELSRSRFNTLAVKLAKRAGVPVVPVALRTDFAGIGRLLRDYGKIHPELPVEFHGGDPLDADNPREAHAKCFAFIQKFFNQWGLPVVD